MEIIKLFKEEKPSKLIEDALKEVMDKGKYEKREAFCEDKNINYETLLRIIGSIDENFHVLGLVAFKKSRLKKIVSFTVNKIKGLESLIE